VPNNSVNSEPENAVLQSLEEGTPKSINDLSEALSGYGTDPERLAKEIAWKLVEEGKARFNRNWLLEARSNPDKHGDE
jgi:hypothetical protein